MPKEQYMCQLCANHGIFNQPKKGHKQKCPYRHCPCPLCALNTKRRRLDQMERQLRIGPNEESGAEAVSSVTENETSNIGLSTVASENAWNESSTSCSPEAVSDPQSQSTPASVSVLPEGKNAYCVALPATMGHTQMKNLKRAAARTPEAEADRKRRTELFEQTLARITATMKEKEKAKTSIFHSVRMLAESG